MEKQRITISIGGRKHPFSVSPDDETKYRAAADKIDERVKAYCRKFPDREMQDILSIVLREMTLKLQALENREEIDSAGLLEQLKALDDKLESYVNGR